MRTMTRQEYLKQLLLLPSDTDLMLVLQPGAGYVGNYRDITLKIFMDRLVAIEYERVRAGIAAFEELIKELPELILQAFAITKKGTRITRKFSGTQCTPGNLSLISGYKIKIEKGSQRRVLLRGAFDEREKEMLHSITDKFGSGKDFCGLLTNGEGLLSNIEKGARFYHTRRVVYDLAYMTASYMALRKIIEDTDIEAENFDQRTLLKCEYPVAINLKERVNWLIKENKQIIKDPKCPGWRKKISSDEIDALQKAIQLPAGAPRDIILHLFFQKISGYLKSREGFGRRQISFLLAKLGILDVCSKCDHYTEKGDYCPKVFMDSHAEMPCERQYRILKRSKKST